MKTLSFDVSTNNTGWAYLNIEKNKTGYTIVEFDYGNIQPSMSMNPCMKLYFFGNRIKSLIEKIVPDEIAFEEPIQIMGHGFTTAKSLARFNGVGLFHAYDIIKKEAYSYEPSKWKKQLGMNSKCHKTEVQLEVTRWMKLLSEASYVKYSKLIKDEYETLNIVPQEKEEMTRLQAEEIVAMKASIKSKTAFKNDMDELKKKHKKEVSDLKASLVKLKKGRTKIFDKSMVQIGTSIYSETGVNFDASDAFGINFCMLKELKFI